MSSPKISVIIPTYNRAAFIGETIESVRKQTYTNWEIIVVDDGSEDNTEAVVKAVGDERIHFYKERRIGIGGKIKNIGLHKASGEFIAFIDSDDLWAPAKLEKQLALLRQFPEAGFCLCGGYNFKTRGKPAEYFYKEKEGTRFGWLFHSVFESQIPGFTQALFFRKECLQKTGPFRETKAFSDIDFIATITYHFKGVVLYEPLFFRRLHGDGYIGPNWAKSYEEGAQLILDFKDKLPAKLFRSALFRLYINFGERHLREKSKRQAIAKFFKAWQYKPFSMLPFKKTGKTLLSVFR
jgi:glycosyltransferase involved in cell wall biosynthesis